MAIRARRIAEPAAKRPRVLVYSGKGGVGKTTVAAATGLRTARLGKRTLVLSVDVAHSLADSFGVTDALRQHPRGTPYPIEDDLWIQEIDIQQEIRRHWDEVFRYFSVLFTQTGLHDVMAEELAIIPGMEDVIALLYLNEYVQGNAYDVIVLDLAPTGESLRFVSMPNTIDWYMRKVFRFERNLARLARPLAKRLADLPLPDESYFREVEHLWKRLEGVDQVLLDPQTTSVRLVTNAEEMVLRETERAHLYFCLYGISVDGLIVNRLLSDLDPATLPPALAHWVTTHRRNLERIRAGFPDIPLRTLPLQPDEVVGTERLARVADALYGPLADGADPTATADIPPPFRLETTDDATTLHVRLPNLDRNDMDIWAEGHEIILRVGGQKRHIPLPRRLADRTPEIARYADGWLQLRFRTDGEAAEDEKDKTPGAEARAEHP